MSDQGVPLGSPISSYEINKVSCLWSSAFWGGLLASPKNSPWQHRLYSTTLGLSAILAAIIGPFSAIALIPRVDWWLQPLQPTILDFNISAYTIYSAASPSQLWPIHLSASDLPTMECLSLNATENFACPAAGYSTILERIGLKDGYNITMPGSGSEGPRHLFVEYDWISSVTSQTSRTSRKFSSIGTSISQIFVRTLSDFYTFLNDSDNLSFAGNEPLPKVVDLNGSNPVKPVVQVECETYVDSSTTKLEFPHSYLNTPPFMSVDPFGSCQLNFSNIYVNESWTMDTDDVWNGTLRDGHMNIRSISFKWVDIKGNLRRPSIAAAVAFPSMSPLVTCSIDARWLPDDLWTTPTLDDTYYESHPNPLILLNTLANPSVNFNSEPINITSEWANALNIPAPKSNLTTIETMLNAFLLPISSKDIDYISGVVSGILALVITDGLARVGLDHDAYGSYGSDLWYLSCRARAGMDCDPCSEGQNVNLSSTRDWTKWNIATYRYGYGYGLANITSKMAVGVLILYVGIAITAILVILIRNCNSDSWSSLGELLVLAMNSQPTDALRNTGAGIDSLNTWKEVVRVRVTEQDKVQMIFEGHEDFDKCYDRKPKVGEKYE